MAEVPAFQLYRDLPVTGFARFDIEVRQAGSIILKMPNLGSTAAGWPAESVSMWLDGRPHKLPAADEPIQLTVGPHRFTFALRIREVSPAFSCQVHTGHLGSAVIQW
jgi:hypothetical protein